MHPVRIFVEIPVTDSDRLDVLCNSDGRRRRAFIADAVSEALRVAEHNLDQAARLRGETLMAG